MQLWFKNLKNFIKQRNKYEFALILGLGLLVFGLFLYLIFPSILGLGINMNYKIKDGNMMFENWRVTPIPIVTKIYLFHIVNPQQFKNGAIPRVREMGPYVYKQYRVRDVIEWSEGKQKIKFWETSTFHFDEELSDGSLDDRITVINVPLLMVFSIINNVLKIFPLNSLISPVVHNVVNVILNTYREQLIETRTAREIINGRRIRLLDTIDIVAKPLRNLGLPIPEYGIASYKLTNNTYGFIAIRNNSKFGPFEVYTGVGQQQKFMKYATARDRSGLGVYRHPSCDALNGTDGAMFGSFIDPEKPIYVFNQHACRSLRAEYFGKTSVNGVSALRYYFAEDLFDGPQKNPNNWCFCPKNVNPVKCEGILDLSQCLEGIPFALSFPHFLFSPKFSSDKNVLGLNPDREKHLGYFDVEPTLGITLRGSGKFQINLKMKPFSFVAGLNDYRPTLLPYLWIDEGAIVDGWLGLLLKTGSWSINGANYAFISSIIIGIITVLVSSVLIYKKRNEKYTIQVKPKINAINNNDRSFDENQVPLELRVEELNGRQHQNMRRLNDKQTSQEQVSQDSVVLFPILLKELHKDLLNKVQRMQYNTTDCYAINGRERFNSIASRRVSQDKNIEFISDDRQVVHSSENTSSHSSSPSIRSQVSLPPIEDGETHTTIIIQRKPIQMTDTGS